MFPISHSACVPSLSYCCESEVPRCERCVASQNYGAAIPWSSGLVQDGTMILCSSGLVQDYGAAIPLSSGLIQDGTMILWSSGLVQDYGAAKPWSSGLVWE